MIIKFTTKRDRSGNRYTLKADTSSKTYKKDYNDAWSYDEYITINKTDRNKLENMLLLAGYMEV